MVSSSCPGFEPGASQSSASSTSFAPRRPLKKYWESRVRAHFIKIFLINFFKSLSCHKTLLKKSLRYAFCIAEKTPKSEPTQNHVHNILLITSKLNKMAQRLDRRSTIGCTVGNRVVISPRNDSSKLCFLVFFWQSIPQLRKNHTMKPLVTCQFFGTCCQSQNFGGTPNLLWLWKGHLWNQISRVLFRFCSAYILGCLEKNFFLRNSRWGNFKLKIYIS